MRLGDFTVLSFDCYGTLIDWESGIWTALQPLLGKIGGGLARDDILAAFARHESAQEVETPGLLYFELLARVHRRLAAEWGVAVRRIGRVEAGAGAFLEEARGLRPIDRLGYDHFFGVAR